MSDKKRAKEPPPPPDAPEYQRSCNQCNAMRDWVIAKCPDCGCPEFRLENDVYAGSGLPDNLFSSQDMHTEWGEGHEAEETKEAAAGVQSQSKTKPDH